MKSTILIEEILFAAADKLHGPWAMSGKFLLASSRY